MSNFIIYLMGVLIAPILMYIDYRLRRYVHCYSNWWETCYHFNKNLKYEYSLMEKYDKWYPKVKKFYWISLSLLSIITVIIFLFIDIFWLINWFAAWLTDYDKGNLNEFMFEIKNKK